MNRFILVLCACLILWALMAGPENFAERYFACGIIQGCDGPRSSIAYLLEPLLGYDFGITVAHMLDITPFVLTVGLLVIAWITKRHEGESEDTEEALTALNRCDGCKTTFRNFDYLIKVDGKGFLCEKCRLARLVPISTLAFPSHKGSFVHPNQLDETERRKEPSYFSRFLNRGRYLKLNRMRSRKLFSGKPASSLDEASTPSVNHGRARGYNVLSACFVKGTIVPGGSAVEPKIISSLSWRRRLLPPSSACDRGLGGKASRPLRVGRHGG
jgi:hypothetical protein